MGNTPCKKTYKYICPGDEDDACATCAHNHVGKEIEVVFVRHGQSQWNYAQKNWRLWEMARRKDHPLSSEGRRQCEELRHRIAETNDFPPVEVLFSSPLARAIETAILVFPDHLRGRVGGESKRLSLVLMPNAREKLNLGGRDSESNSVGEGIVNGAFKDLSTLYDKGCSDTSPTSRSSCTKCPESGDESDSSPVRCSGRSSASSSGATVPRSKGKLVKKASILDDRKMCHIDVSEVQEKWCSGTAAIGEALPQFRCRLEDFMHQLMHSTHESMCVVGHSHFIRSVFREYLNAEFCAEQPELSELLQKFLIPNCGVVQCKIRCGKGGKLSITKVDMLYDTVITPPEKARRFHLDCLGGCRNADRNVDENEIVIPDSPTMDARRSTGSKRLSTLAEEAESEAAPFGVP